MKTLTKNNWSDMLRKDGLSVIKVYANWCGPCKLLKTRFHKWEEEFGSDEVNFFEIDRDNDKEFSTKILKIEALPTILFFMNGKEVNRIRGLSSRIKFMEVLDKTLSQKGD
jgi:thioredoxin 1